MFASLRRWILFSFLFIALPIKLVSAQPLTHPVENLSSKISTTAENGIANDWLSNPAISADGRKVVFISNASNLVSGDTNETADIFLYDRSRDQIQPLSISNTGEPGNRWSYQPAISADGRYVAFTSLSNNLDPKSGKSSKQAQIFLRDLIRNQTSLISVNNQGELANGWSECPSISGDGRFIAFTSLADNLIAGETNHSMNVYVTDRKFGQIEKVSGNDESPDQEGWNNYPQISADGRTIAYIALRSNGQVNTTDLLIYDRLTGDTANITAGSLKAGLQVAPYRLAISADGGDLVFSAWDVDHQISLYLYNRDRDQIFPIPESQIKKGTSPSFAMTANGHYVTYFSSLSNGDRVLRTFDQEGGQSIPVPILLGTNFPDENWNQLASSANGAILAIAAPFIQTPQEVAESITTPKGISGLSIFQQKPYEPFSAFISGWVSDALGSPLARVTISDDYGHKASTGKDGSFRIDGLISANYLLTPEKKGYEFSPSSQKISSSSARNGASGVSFTASPKGILKEAEKDVGMPYALTRGCPSPKTGCDGPYHGFYSGDCTDLVIDAYKEGVDFDIQFAIDRDFQAHPDHYYFWRNARSSQDMWRYFAYTGQTLTNSQPYQPGDIVFFDWDEDGISDHVAIISEVSNRNRPLKMYDASGITQDNPTGLAAELPWQSFHDAHVQGHVRWSGNARPESQTSNKEDSFLLVALDSPQAKVRLLDDQGRAIGAGELAIQGGSYEDLQTGAVIALRLPAVSSDWYFIEISGPVQSAYQLGIQVVNAGRVSQDIFYQRSIQTSGTQLIPVKITRSDGSFTFLEPQIPDDPEANETQGVE